MLRLEVPRAANPDLPDRLRLEVPPWADGAVDGKRISGLIARRQGAQASGS